MRNVNVLRLSAVSHFLGLIQSVIAFVVTLFTAFSLGFACHLAATWLSSVVIYVLFQFIDYPAQADFDGSNFLHDIVMLYLRSGIYFLPIVATCSAIAFGGYLLARMMEQARLSRIKVSVLALTLLILSAYGLLREFSLFLLADPFSWTFSVFYILFFPLSLAMDTMTWIGEQFGTTSETFEGQPVFLLWAGPVTGLAFLVTYLWIECLKELISFAIDPEYRSMVRRSFALPRLTLPKRYRPNAKTLLKTLAPLGLAFLKAAAVGLLAACFAIVVVSRAAWFKEFFAAVAEISGGKLGIAYVFYFAVFSGAAFLWAIARQFRHISSTLVETMGLSGLFFVGTWIAGRAFPDDNSALGAVLLIFPLTIVAFAQRSLMWRGLIATSERWQSAVQPPLGSRADAGDAPTLYLRAFKDDNLTLHSGFDLLDLLMGRFHRPTRFEVLVATRISTWRPVVALGNPHIPLQFHGALKRHVQDGDWQEEVAYWNSFAAYTVMIANQTENIGWEVALLQTTKRHRQTIFVLTSSMMAKQFFNHYGILGETVQHDLQCSALIVYNDHEYGWTCLFSPIRTYRAYRIALDIALSRMESHFRSIPRSAGNLSG